MNFAAYEMASAIEDVIAHVLSHSRHRLDTGSYQLSSS